VAFFIAAFGGALAVAENFVFNSKEIDSIQYEVKITGDPVLSSDEIKANQMTMKNKFGQSYRCSIPDIGEEESAAAGKTAVTDGATDSATDGAAGSSATTTTTELTTENVKNLLAPLADEPCLVRTKDWWSYELCHNKAIRQYHMEDGKPSGAILVLGYYDHDQDWSNSGQNRPANKKFSHHSQFFTNGSLCDLTNELRKAEVRFECDPLASSGGSRIIRVDEPQSCEYIITVSTPNICSVPQLKRQEVPKPKEISCSPLFTQHEYDKWLDIKAKRASLLERKQAEMKRKQKEEMLKVVEGEDISGIDVETEEGMSKLEGMVGDKLADKLINSITDLVGGGGANGDDVTGIKSTTKATIPKFKEVVLASGEKKSVPVELENENEIEDDDDDDDLDDIVDADEKMIQVLEGLTEMLDQATKQLAANNKPGGNSKLSMDTLTKLRHKMVSEVVPQINALFEKAHQGLMKIDGEDNDDEEALETIAEIKAVMKKFDREMARIDELSGQLLAATEEIESQTTAKTAGDDQIESKENGGKFKKTNDPSPGDLGAADDNDSDKLAESKSDKSDSISGEKSQSLAEDATETPKSTTVEKESTKDDLEKEEEEDVSDDLVDIKVTKVGLESSKVRGLGGQSESEQRVVKHLENSIKQKIAKSGLEIGGRTIEVKVITAGGGAIPANLDANAMAELGGGATEDERQLQGMVYNLMVGNQQGYNDIDNQRKSEVNYKFSLDELSKDTDERELEQLPTGNKPDEGDQRREPVADESDHQVNTQEESPKEEENDKSEL